MPKPIEVLRESFSRARSEKQEQFYGLAAEPWTIPTFRDVNRFRRVLLPAHRIVWRNAATKEWGELAIVKASDVVPLLAELLDELERLRSLRTMKKAA
jgi:hypothetical protein